MGNNIQIFGRTFSDVSSITVNNTSSSAVKYVQEPIFEDITISSDYLVEQNTVVSNGIIFQTDETYPGTPVVINNTTYTSIDNGSLGQSGTGIKIDLNKTYHCTGELKIEWSTGEQEIYSIDSDFILSGYGTNKSLSFSWEGVGTSVQTFYNISFRSSGTDPKGYNFYIQAIAASSLTKSGVLLDGSYYQISVTSNGFNTINLNLSDDPRFQAIYKSLAYRSTIASSAPGVSEWCNSLSRISRWQFAGQEFNGSFTFNNVTSAQQGAFGVVWNGNGASLQTSAWFNFPNSALSVLSQDTFLNNGMIRGISANNVNLISANAFYNCMNLSEVNFPNCATIGISAFCNCGNLSSISFPNCVTISAYAFQSCSSLSNISFPNCTSISDRAFSGCSQLTSISFPNCTTISNYAFQGCIRLSNISFPSCTTIGSYAFSGCSQLTSISFPNCISIGSWAFQSCSALTTVNFPSCTTIGPQAFYQCFALTTANFPNCTSIGVYAFQSCRQLISISFPNCISIDPQAFYQCFALTTASFPNCTSIGSSTFYNCSALTIVNFPSCTTIGSYAFWSCSQLTTVSFPKCTYISNSAFCFCSNISSFYFMGSSIPYIASPTVFYYTPLSNSSYLGYYGSIYVPSSLLASYKTATNWTTYSARIVGI